MAFWAPTENFRWADDVEESIPLPSWAPSNSAIKNEAKRPKGQSTKLSWDDEYLKRAGVSGARTDCKASELDSTEQTAMEEDQSDESTSSVELRSPADHVEQALIAFASPLEANISANGEADASGLASTDGQNGEEVDAFPTGNPSDDEELSSSSVLSQICEDAWGEDIENFDTADEQSHEKDFVASLTERLLHAPRGKDAAERAPEENQSDGKDEGHNTRLSGPTTLLPANEGQQADAIGQRDEMENRDPRWKVGIILFLFCLYYCCLCMGPGMPRQTA